MAGCRRSTSAAGATSRRNRAPTGRCGSSCVLYGLSLFAEFIANDKPLLVQYRANITRRSSTSTRRPNSAAISGPRRSIRDIEVQCLIVSRAGGLLGRSRGVIAEVPETGAFAGEPIEQGLDDLAARSPTATTPINDLGTAAPSPPDGDHWLGTDDTARDVLARVIYGFRLSVSFHAHRDVHHLGHRHRRRRDAGLLSAAGRPDLPADASRSGIRPVALRHHHHVRDPRANFWLLVFLIRCCSAGRRSWAWCARSSCARGTSNTSAPRGRWACRTGRSCSATCCPTRWWRR
jgi:hypothetical protein